MIKTGNQPGRGFSHNPVDFNMVDSQMFVLTKNTRVVSIFISTPLHDIVYACMSVFSYQAADIYLITSPSLICLFPIQ